MGKSRKYENANVELALNQDSRINQVAIDSIDNFGTSTSGSKFLEGSTTKYSTLEAMIAKIHQKEDAMVLSLMDT